MTADNFGIIGHASRGPGEPEDGNGSDHNTIAVDVTIAAAGSTEGNGGLSWPLDVKYWKQYRSDWLGGHIFSSHTFTSPEWEATATDISQPPDGSPIYSMLDGTVTSASSCRVIVASKVQGGTLEIAYGHGTNVKVSGGDKVNSGQQLSSLAANCNASGGHLHVDMAFNGRHLCPQDVFLAMDKGNSPDYAALAKRITKPTSCAR
jgi:murein DD-endopeptidase MepM/ murein hydrolase activator NlpD